MSESIVEASVFEIKMGESVTSVATLDTSVSFGRFENDSLSWEKWSTFSPNKYLEEVEKCSTPGTVAQKKAYFEAHYKNFPARKTDVELDKLSGPAFPMLDQSNRENDTENDTVFRVGNGEGSTEEVNPEASVFSVVNSITYDDVRDDVDERSDKEVENSTTFDDVGENVSERSLEEFENSLTFDGIKEDVGNRSIEEVDNITSFDDIREDVSETSLEEFKDISTFDAIKEDVTQRSIEEVENSTSFDDIREDVTETSLEEFENSFTFDGIKEDGDKRSIEEVENSTSFDDIREDVSKRSTEEVDQEVDLCSAVKSTTSFDAVSKEVNQEAAVSSVITSITFDDIKEHVDDRSNEEVEHEAAVSSVVSSREDNSSAGECQSSLVEEFKEETSGSQSVNAKESNDREKVMLLEEEHTSQKTFPKVAKKVSKVDNETKKFPESGNRSQKVKARNITQKKTPKTNPTLAGAKKKLTSPAPKSSPVSAPRLSKTTPTSSSISTSQSSSKNFSGALLPRNKHTPVRENRRAAPTSMHMSLNFGQGNSSVSPASTRKSLIMEQMADKDIIKRAFKSFQNNYSPLRSSMDDKFSGVSQVPSEVPERKVMPSLTPRKENEGLRKAAADKRTPQRGQAGNKFSSASSGLGSSAAKKNVKAVSPSIGLRSDEKAEKRREFLKKLEQKSIAREVEKAQLSVKSKEENSDMGKGKQSSNLIAMPVRTYSKGGLSKSSQKEVVKNKVHLQNR